MAIRRLLHHCRSSKKQILKGVSVSDREEALSQTCRAHSKPASLEHLSLVIFTVLAQASAGLSLALLLMTLGGDITSQAMLTKGYLTTIVLLGVAGIASISHLGQPFRVMNVMTGLAHGLPLSWEIVAVTFFGSMAFITGILNATLHPLGLSAVLLLLTAASGLLMVYAISRVYTLHTVQAWNTRWTIIQFITSALLLGCILGTLLLSTENQSSELMRSLSLAVIGCVLAQLPSMTQFVGRLEGQLSIVVDHKLPAIRLLYQFGL